VTAANDWSDLPGAELVAQGLRDAARGVLSPEALLVAIGAPRLERLGLHVPAVSALESEGELALYRTLCARGELDPYSRYNALLRELVSFERALEHRHFSRLRSAHIPTRPPPP